MLSFTFDAHIPRTVFGAGTLEHVPQEVERLGVNHVLLVTESRRQQLALAERVKQSLGSKVAGMSGDPKLTLSVAYRDKLRRCGEAYT